MATQHPSYVTVNADHTITQENCDTTLFWLSASRGIGNPAVVRQTPTADGGMYVKVDAPTSGNHKTATAQVAGMCTLLCDSAAACKKLKEKYNIKANYSTLPTELVFVLEHID